MAGRAGNKPTDHERMATTLRQNGHLVVTTA
jgi:hypothetical protein